MRRSTKPIAACSFLALTLLSGCEAVNAANEFLAERERRADEERIFSARASCLKFGFANGTDAFSTCVQTEVNQQKLRDEIEAAALLSRSTSSSSPAAPSSNPSTTTTCRKTLLGTVECTTR